MPGRLFPLGGPVSEKDIVDREDFLVSLGTRLLEGQSIMLAGPRRIGKTSLALEVLRRLKTKESYVAFVDLFRYNTKKELSLAIIDACLENRSGINKTTAALKDGLKKITGGAKLTAKVQDLEVAFGLPSESRSDDELFNYALQLPEILAKRDKKRNYSPPSVSRIFLKFWTILFEYVIVEGSFSNEMKKMLDTYRFSHYDIL